MALADPQSVTINAIATSLPRVTSQVANGNLYKASDGNTDLTVSHSVTSKGRLRHNVRLHTRKVAADPLTSTSNSIYDMSCQITIDVPPYGYTVAEAKLVVQGLLDALSASTYSLTTKVLGGEA